MNIKEDIRPVSFLKGRTAELFAQIERTQRPVVITENGEPRGVLQDVESYERMRRAIGMLKLIAQGEEDIRAGRTIPHDVVFARLHRRLKRRARKNG